MRIGTANPAPVRRTAHWLLPVPCLAKHAGTRSPSQHNLRVPDHQMADMNFEKDARAVWVDGGGRAIPRSL
jgi:hypothetical protein